MMGSDRIVVASASLTRHDMLKRAGLAFTVDPADIDEAAIRETLSSNDEAVSPADIAEVLARTKGETVSGVSPMQSSSPPIRCWRWATRYLQNQPTSTKRAKA